MSVPPETPPRKKSSLLVNILARLLIIGEKLGPFRRPVLWVGCIIVVLLLLGFIPRILRGRRLAAESRAEAQQVPAVTVARAERSPTQVALTLPGNIQAVEQTQLSARTTGYVKRYLADLGDRVQAGQILAEIDTPEVDQQAQQAEAELARAQATLAQATAQQAQQRAALQTARANAARANADLSRSEQTAAQQRAQLREARANAELARVTWRRWQSLVAGGAISQQEADERQAAYNSSLANVSALEAALRAGNSDVQAYKAALNAAQADVSAAGENVRAYGEAVNAARAGVAASLSNVRRFNVLSGFRQVRAPYAGVITARNVEEGALISAGGAATSSSSATSDTNSGGSSSSSVTAPASGSGRVGNTGLFTLARIDQLRIYIDVPQTEASEVRAGQSASVSVKELPKRSFIGLINRTSSALDQTTRTLRAEVRLPNNNGILLPGMYAQVKFDVTRLNPPVLVPSSALIADAQGNRIAIAQENKVAFRKVELGRDFGESLEVTSGLQPGDLAITNPSDDLREGGQVKSTMAKPAKDPNSGGGSSGGSQKPDQGGHKPGGQKPGGQKPQEGSEAKKQGGAAKNGESQSMNQNAKKQIVKQGNESNEPRAQPGGAAREAAEQKQKKSN